MAERFYPQERLNTCLLASLRTVLANQFGVRVGEDVLRFVADDAVNPIVKLGANTTDLRRMLAAVNRARNPGSRWRLRTHRHGTIIDLAREVRAGRYPIAGVVNPDGEQHAIVIRECRDGRVRFFDPARGESRWLRSRDFSHWWLADGGITWYAVVVGGA